MRVPQPSDGRGSLKWMQRLAAREPHLLLDAIEPSKATPKGKFTWLSPLEGDGHAEYRDGDFLECIGHPELKPALNEFWPSRGPQWDGLGRFDDGTIVLVEAKANIPELKSKCAASARSREKIDRALAETARALRTTVTSAWTNEYYQYANRLAHLHFLRAGGVSAMLLFVYFTGDDTINAPADATQWHAPLRAMEDALRVTTVPSEVRRAFIPVEGLA